MLALICGGSGQVYTAATMNRTAQLQGRHCATEPRLFALILAAGSSRRFGTVKQLAQFKGKSLVAHAVRKAEQLCGSRCVLVTGHANRAVHAACAPLQGYLAVNDGYADGLGSSIACGIAAIRSVADGVVIMLADQPLIAVADLERLAERWREQPKRAVACGYAGNVGVPAIFPAADFERLSTLSGDRGARDLLAAHGDDLLVVDCDAAAIDIDRPADLASLR